MKIYKRKSGWRGAIMSGAGAVFALSVIGSSLAAQEIGHHPMEGPPPLPEVTSWPLYNGSLGGQRFSDLTAINADNAANIQEVCRVQVGELGSFYPGPVLANGMMYITIGRVTMAINPTTCAIIWKSTYRPMAKEGIPVNRGVAYADEKLFRGLPDGSIIAYDALTGQQIWRKQAIDWAKGELFTSAPIVWNGMLFIGIANSEGGIRGRMFAFDANTGEKLWQFNLVPQEGEPGTETWKGRSYEQGGGGTWTSYALDPDTGELFVPVANPAPVLDTAPRVGNKKHTNLYTNSIVVLDAKTGKLKWFYQTRPSDNHDYGVTSPPMLFEGKDGRKLVALGNKDGHVYVIDRTSHKMVFKRPVVRLHNLFKTATPEGITICPGVLGGIEWNGVAFDRLNRSLIAGAVDWCHKITLAPQPYVMGQVYYGGRMMADGDKPDGTITAIDPDDGHIRWQFKPGFPVVSAITPTAGGVTFAGDLGGNFYTLRSSNGEVLRKIATGGALAGGIVTYEVNKKQYVALTSGNVSRSTFGASGIPTMVIYAVGAAPAPAAATSAATPKAAAVLEKPDAEKGKALYETMCAACHGAAGEGQAGPKLAGISGRATSDQVAEWIRNPKSEAMPRMVPDVVSESDVGHLTAFLMSMPGKP
ncbi:PQQ-binding-like beta-propeller repeat protein [Sphingobium phenoxybenzoativorans]|uniref:outer membrane protein assembly factor BamB family protein n=1 Tax=Sphingobium phenoxybenzoativorans TaxID=1592790 RepID=UPI00087247CB|nr:PQQ-binding-like beta-propeller repeat protein [Sphingobium phenoxybenzoativorans]